MANAIPSRVTRVGAATSIVAATDTQTLGAGASGREARGLPAGIAGEFPVFVLVATEDVNGATLDVVVEDSMDGTTWFTLITFTQLSASGSEIKVPTRMPLPYVRCTDTVTGSPGTYSYVVDCDTRRNNP